ncbi:MAG TPA: GNAT family N-acetyltransferase [Cyclobacteriaceae bacterium]
MKWLVFPDVTKKGDRIKKDFKGTLALHDSKPVGLAFGLPDEVNKRFRLVSLKVSPEHQNQKIATRLLYNLEKAIKTEGYCEIELHYRSHWKTIPVLKKMLTRLAWTDPVFTLRICQSKIEQAFPVFHSNHQLPEGYEFTAWKDVTNEEKKIINSKKEQEAWFTDDVSPFQLSHMIEHNVSIALRYYNEIVGWLVIHQITPETLEYTALFVDDHHRTFKIGHLLMGESINRQAEQKSFPKFLFTVKASNKIMVRFIERNGPVNGMVVTDVYEVKKKV